MPSFFLIPTGEYGYKAKKCNGTRASRYFQFFDEAMNYVRMRADEIHICNHSGQVEARVDNALLRRQVQSLTPRLRDWLGKDGRKFFTDLIDKYGKIPLVIQEGAYPHPVHLREGMSCRNWLREQPECADWDLGVVDMYDYIYMEMLYRAVNRPIQCPITGQLIEESGTL